MPAALADMGNKHLLRAARTFWNGPGGAILVLGFFAFLSLRNCQGKLTAQGSKQAALPRQPIGLDPVAHAQLADRLGQVIAHRAL